MNYANRTLSVPIGKRFNNFTILSDLDNDKYGTRWVLAECVCGSKRPHRFHTIRSGANRRTTIWDDLRLRRDIPQHKKDRIRKKRAALALMATAIMIFFIGCTSSTSTKREETTTTREIDTLIQVAPIKESGQSDNYNEWRRWLLPILNFQPDSVQPEARFTSEDSTVNVRVNLRTGKTTAEVKPPPVEAKIKETQTHVKEESLRETESWFEDPLRWGAIILALLLVGFVAVKLWKK